MIEAITTFSVIDPSGKERMVELPSSMLILKKDVPSDELLTALLGLEEVVAKHENKVRLGFAMDNSISINSKSRRVGHWVYLSGIGFAFHLSDTFDNLVAGVEKIVGVISPNMLPVIAKMRDQLKSMPVVSNKEGNA